MRARTNVDADKSKGVNFFPAVVIEMKTNSIGGGWSNQSNEQLDADCLREIIRRCFLDRSAFDLLQEVCLAKFNP
ncbi:hypothetical protein Dimus_024306 [Dionaea muscipula]